MIDIDCDVLIVGAGPAGSSAASCLAEAGMKTIIVDKNAFPRSKQCGNLISGYCLKNLNRMVPKEIIQGYIQAATIRYAHQVKILFREPIGIFVNRRDFDHQLLKWAVEDGAEFLPDAEVIKIEREKEQVITYLKSEKRIRSQFLIGADGALGIVNRYVRGKKYKRWEQAVAFSCEMHKEHFLPEYQKLENEIYLDVSVPGGYAWIFAEGNCLNIGMGTSFLLLKKIREKISPYVKEKLYDYGVRVQSRGYPLPLGGIHRKLYKNRVLLAGDAAGIIDPVSGEGIGFAVKSGQLAAQAIIEGRKDPRIVGKRYAGLFKINIEKEIRPLLIYAALVFFLRPMFFALHPDESKEIFTIQFESVGGQVSHRQFVRNALRKMPTLLYRSLLKKKDRKA